MLLFAETGDYSGHYPPYYYLTAYINGGYFAAGQAADPVNIGSYFSRFHGGSGSGGCLVSFTDGHAIFWKYAGDIEKEYRGVNQMGPDIRQLAAWSGVAQIPPGVNP